MLNVNFKQAIDSLQADPMACASLALRALENSNDGEIRIIDPSNPFVYLMETSVVLYTNSLDRQITNLSRQYVANARNWNELYRHMSDKDFEGIFSTPGQAPIMFFLDVEEIIEKAIPVNDSSGS